MPKSMSELMMMIANITAIAAIVMVAFKIRKYIEERVEDALSKDEIINKISLLVKPDMIFDDKGSIVIDRGASTFVKDKGVSVVSDDSSDYDAPSEIRIAFIKHLKTPPLLTPLNPDATFVRPRRGESHDWIYELTYSMTTTTDEPGFTRRYRLEIF
jgi:hypothetical protein